MDAMSDVISRPSARLSEIHGHWGWFVALGVVFLIAGLLAFSFVFAATLASVLMYGVLLLAGGIAQIVHAFQVRTWGNFLMWMLVGLLYGIAGILIFINPVLASAVLTLMIGLTLVVVGVLRVVAAWQSVAGRGWLMVGGALTVLLGLLIVFGWPASTMWAIGLFLAIDLIYEGVAFLMLGLAAKRA